MPQPTDRSGESRRRKTCFRKIRQLCALCRMRAIVVLVDESDKHWIFKTHDDIPDLEQAIQHPQTHTYDDFEPLPPSSRRIPATQPSQRQITMLAPPSFRRD
ncbi:hypothetical protein N7471_008352 [Penicillium samsonianum]|uniref:uncharacterized protein n=1 Tax=Penicillium samsonianum TaxID=1882272 RepID=UPI00254741AD|nr:uncharacterized protein N7471_008352 [Penicillium samsonianum]KAJ6133137.1 hypothetical protein N7471_008352 [Penicillium samsonianum]